MPSVKIILRKKQTYDGTYPLAVRITKNRASSFTYLGQNIEEKYWDAKNQRVKKSHPNSARLNNYLIKKLAEANDKLLELETHQTGVSAKAVKQALKPFAGGSSFSSFADQYLDNFKKAGKYNRFYPDQSRVTKFKEFLNESLNASDIAFQDITVPLLDRFRAYLKGTHHASERSILNHLIIIRTIFNLAITSNAVDQKYYPFGKDKVQIKLPDSQKIGLTPEEVKRIEELELESPSPLNHARNVWLFSFYFAGMRVSDILRLKWSDFQNERLYYAMGKNAKTGSLKIPEKALNIISQYENQRKGKNDLVFPELKVLTDLANTYEVQRKISYAVKRLDQHLKKLSTLAKIDKPLTMHIARHTFGNISGDRIPIQMLQKLYRHSSITTTIGYQANFIHKSADEALDAVINL